MAGDILCIGLLRINHLCQKSEMEETIVSLLGGRVAESLILK